MIPTRHVRQGLPLAATGLVAALLLSFGFPCAAETTSPGAGVESPGGWSTLHRSPANRKLVRGVSLAEGYSRWTVLAGASVLTAPTMSPDGQTLYVTTGRAAGASNLHAFSLDGRLRWRAAAWADADRGVDPCAILSSPIVDREGDVYIGDCNQLHAFHADGRIKWVAALPGPRAGEGFGTEGLPINALTTAAFTRAGHVFGVTNFGDVVVFDRETGRRLDTPMRLPGHRPGASAVMPMPETVFAGGLVDPAIREWAWQLLAGAAMPSANTPAVDLVTGRLYVAATATTEGLGALYALDLVATEAPGAAGGPLRIEIAFATEMGPGSGSSPSLSPAADTVYVSDENGLFYAVDARTGALRWQVATRAASAAAAVGANGDIYALQAFGPAVVAIRPDGTIRWESDLGALTQAALPRSWLLGDPVALGNGNPTVVDDVVLVPVVYGYETSLGRRIPWPVRSTLVAVDAATGRGLRDLLELVDDSTGVTGVLPDGTITNTLGTALTSGVSPLAGVARWLLPGDLEPLEPLGGLQVSRPLSAEALAARRALEARLAARSEGDRKKDARRRPVDVLSLGGIGEGTRVLELMAGSGWYAEVLARAVGAGGRVVAHNNPVSHERYGPALTRRLERAALPAVESIVAPLDPPELAAWSVPPGSQDAVLLAQFYHDTVWMGVDRATLNRRVFEALRPGGVFLVIDHRAAAGAGSDVVETLHRIEPELVVREVEAAGLRLTHRSSLLANPGDDLLRSVFDDGIRGRTDRFLLRFEKPGGS